MVRCTSWDNCACVHTHAHTHTLQEGATSLSLMHPPLPSIISGIKGARWMFAKLMNESRNAEFLIRHLFERIFPLLFPLISKWGTWQNAREKETMPKTEPEAWVLTPPLPLRSEQVRPHRGFLILWFFKCKMKKLDWRKPTKYPVWVILWLKAL